MNYIVFIILCMALIFIVPTLYAKRVGFIVACVFSLPLSIGIVGITMLSLDLESEPIIEEYLKSSYETTIDKEDISDILNDYEENGELLNLSINKIPKSDSINVKLDIRKGKYIYRDMVYTYNIGLENDKVFIENINL